MRIRALLPITLLAPLACGSSNASPAGPDAGDAATPVITTEPPPVNGPPDASSGASDATASVDGAGETSSPLSPAPTIATDSELCGVSKYSGTFVVKAGVTLTCKTGELEIQADDVVVEGGAAIVVEPTSTRVGGNSATPCFTGSISYYSGASGGGYGIAGASGEIGYGGGDTGVGECDSCYPPAGGPAFGSLDDMIVEAGSKGGDGCKGGGPTCPAGNELAGGLGGGVVRIRATSSIEILGEVHADGGHGEAYATQFIGASGSAGGGSGGGILLAAPAVEVGANAALTTRGGLGRAGWQVKCISQSFESKGGAGAPGRVKIATSSPEPPATITLVGAFTFGPFPP